MNINITGLAPDKPLLPFVPFVGRKPVRAAGQSGQQYRDRADVAAFRFHRMPKARTFTVQRRWPVAIGRRGSVECSPVVRSVSVLAYSSVEAKEIVQAMIDRAIDTLKSGSTQGAS